MLETVLCVDIGTTSLKAGLLTADGEVVFLSRKSFKNPDERFIANEWLDALKAAVCGFDFSSVSLKGICVSGAGPTVVLEDGLTFRWNEKVPEDVVLPAETGFSLFLSRVLTLKNYFSASYEKSHFVFSGPEFFIYKLTGKALTILPEKRYVQAYWNDAALELCGIESGRMPEYAGIGKNAGTLLPEIAKKLGGLPCVPVFTGAPDFIVAMIGTNTLSAGKLCDRAGSSEGLNFCTDRHFFNSKTRTLPSAIEDLWNVSALSTESGRIFVDFKHSLEKSLGKAVSYDELICAAMADEESEAGKIISKILTQVEDSLETLKKVLKENGIEFPEVMTVTGGQAKNDVWMQLKANILKMELLVCNCADSELVGDACAAFYGLGKYSSLKDAAENIVKITKRFVPENENL